MHSSQATPSSIQHHDQHSRPSNNDYTGHRHLHAPVSESWSSSSQNRPENSERTVGQHGAYSAGGPVCHHHHYYTAPPLTSHQLPPPPPQIGNAYPSNSIVYHHSLGLQNGGYHSTLHGLPSPVSQHASDHSSNGSYFAPAPPLDWSQPLPPIRLRPPSLAPVGVPYISTLPAAYHTPAYSPWSSNRSSSSTASYPDPSQSYGAAVEQAYNRWPSHPDHRRLSPPPALLEPLSYNRSQGREPTPASRTVANNRVVNSEQYEEQVKFEDSVQALQSLASAAGGSRNGDSSISNHNDSRPHASSSRSRDSQPHCDDTNSTTNNQSNASPSGSKTTWRGIGTSHNRGGSQSADENGEGVIGSDGKVKKKRKRRRKATEEPRDFASRKFTCSTCKKMFARPSALATHERSHSKEKPHVCPVQSCQRPFAVPSNLRRHQRVYNHYDPNAPLPPEGGPGSRNTRARTDSTASP